MSRVQQFDTTQFRVIADAVPPPAEPTLAAIYAAGLADVPLTDNMFAMPAGNRRWADQTSVLTTHAPMSDSFWETPGVNSSTDVGAWVTQRYVVTSSRPSTTFRSDVLYNAAYAGLPIDGMEWIADDCWMTADQTTQSRIVGDVYAKRRYNMFNFFGGLPVSMPDPGIGSANFTREITDLQNGAFSVGSVRATRELTGWGQELLYTYPQRAGITPSVFSLYDGTAIIDAAGNGTGLMIGQGRFAHAGAGNATGLYEAHMLAGNVNGAWGLGLWAFDGVTPGVLTKVATFDNTGATVLGSSLSTLDGDPAAATTYTLDCNFTSVAGTDLGAIVPGRAGKYFVARTIQFLIVAVTGVATNTPQVTGGTLSPTYADLFAAVGPTAAVINFGLRSWSTVSLAGPTVAPPVSGAAMHLKMATAVTGATALTVRVTIQGFWAVG